MVTEKTINSPGKLYQLEALRGFAALYVVIHHNVNFSFKVGGFDLVELTRFGQEAVILFFLISGFVIHYSVSVNPPANFKDYFFKRFLRIYVPLILVFIAGYLSESYNSGALVSADIKKFLLNIVMLQDWVPARPNVIVEPLLGNTPLWSLAYEWWFYMLYYPIYAFLKTHNRRSVLVFVMAILSALVYVYLPYFLPRFLAYFAIWWMGVHLGEVYLVNGRITLKACLVPLLCLAALCLILSFDIFIDAKSADFKPVLGFHPVLELRHFTFALIAVMLGIGWHRWQWKYFNFIFGPFIVLAPISYVIYISHYHLITNATYLSFIGNRFVELFGYFLTMLVFSWVVECIVYPAVRKWFYRRKSIKNVLTTR